jgi:hypothetical protein
LHLKYGLSVLPRFPAFAELGRIGAKGGNPKAYNGGSMIRPSYAL